MKLKDIRISKRLFIGFGILDLLMVALVITGITATKRMNDRLEGIVNNNDAMIEAAYDVKDGVVTINLTTLASFTTKDEAYKTQAANTLGVNRAKYKAATDKIEKLEDTSEGKDLVKAIKDTIAHGREGNDKAIELAKSGKPDEAVATYVAEVLPNTTKIIEDCDTLIRYEQKRSVEVTG